MLEHRFTGVAQQSDSTTTEYTSDGIRGRAPEGDSSYTAMIDHVLACLRGEADNRIAPESVLATVQLTLDIHESVRSGIAELRVSRR
ncbi:hypothetical protein [Nocardia pseudobrasiliensis]|uniref:hypothetical protein n=1 Tax=Nocardia pseudobrasiliensis TaxID=45979 RepID=UPI0011C05F18|nr:hypothetical protein [Nocardia pseudobrasiliensis]